MTALIITPDVQAEIAAMIERARAKPVIWDKVRDSAFAEIKPKLSLADRKPGTERPPSQLIIIPLGYHVAFSFEEQPAGMFRHLSVSVRDGKMMPNHHAVVLIAGEFGIDVPPHIGRAWIEEFAPGRHAVNIIQLESEREAGHA